MNTLVDVAVVFGFLWTFGACATYSGSRRGFVQCLPHQFACNDTSRCIPTKWLCDGENDCPDNSDEDRLICEKIKTCNSQEFMCANNQCIPAKWQCDKENDCHDESDERNCTQSTCSPEEFSCGNGCIPKAWQCDTQTDCADGSDEKNCEAPTCQPSEWTCLKSKRCIVPKWRCDHDHDCGEAMDGTLDTSDEDNCTIIACSQEEFSCGTGKPCVPKSWMCDGERDCPDGSDEHDCKKKGNTCLGAHDWACNDGKCIVKQWLCDGDPDCPDESDELNCTSSCKPREFQCLNVTSHRCIPIVLQCNGVHDCDDGSDELGCVKKPNLKCNGDHFDCGDGFCIPNAQVCDGKMNCPKGEDEQPALPCGRCENKSGVKCDPPLVCVNTPIGSQCRCLSGYQLSKDNKTCEDVDECSDEVNRVCSQICNNTVGGYHCKCYENFVMQKDGKSCRAIGDHPQLLVSNRVTVRKFDLIYKRYVPLVTDMDSAVALDYVYETQTLIWSDMASDKIIMCHLANDTVGTVLNATTCTDAIVENETQTPDGLAVDWIHQLLYWTDTGNDSIFVIQLDGKKHRKRLIEGGMDEPRAIALDPSQGLIFWTDWGAQPKLERASMDGSHRQAIVESEIMWPNGLAIDFLDQRVFWADAKLRTISSCDYHGEKRRILVLESEHLKHPFSLAVFEEKLYWTDWDTEGVHTTNKFTGKNTSILIRGLFGPMTVKVYQEHTQPRFENKCFHHECSHLCLPRAKEQWLSKDPKQRAVSPRNIPYSCVCPDSVPKLSEDGKTCHTGLESSAESNKDKSDENRKESIDQSETDEQTAGGGDEPKQQGHMAAVIIAILSSIALVVALMGYVFYRKVTRSPGKGLMFDNPTYRPTTLPVDDQVPEMESIQYNPVNPYLLDGQLSFSNAMTEPLTKSFSDEM